MRTKSRIRVFRLLVVGATWGLLTIPPASAQKPHLNHLDCWFDAGANSVRCPSPPTLQEGRGARVDPQRVDRAFDQLDGPDVQMPDVPDTVEAPKAPKVQKTRVAKPRRAKVAQADPRTPSCRTYRSYNAANNTYRSYDGVVRRCKDTR